MPLTERHIVPLEGEQLAVFQGLRDREIAALAPIQAERNAMVTAILAGKGLLARVNSTPGLNISVEADGIHLVPPSAPALVE